MLSKGAGAGIMQMTLNDLNNTTMGAPKGKVGRPDTYDYNLCVEICSKVALGAHIKAVLDSKDDYPTFQTWCNWKREHDELFDLYTKAIQDKAEMVAFEIDETMRQMRAGEIDAPVGRVLIDTLKWYASKFYPRMFGDKIDVTSGDKPIQSAPISVVLDGQVLQASSIKVSAPENQNDA